ncbi:MAG: RluA family pseudouridine synthase [Actinomycetota bacterium]|nr:RluA family pseudouridine synthase [Actinomycetota bacterium]
MVSSEDEGERLDIFLSKTAGISRSKAQDMIASGLAHVNEKPANKNHTLREGEIISWAENHRDLSQDVVPEDIPIEIIYEDEHICVVNKPAGMVMYPGPGHSSGTLLNALAFRFPEILILGGKGRGGIFHRLDKDTSGVVAVARSEEAYQKMVMKMSKREVEKDYIALVRGQFPFDRGTIDVPVGRNPVMRKKMKVRPEGREAISKLRVLERFKDYTLLEVKPETGRTHQIRVHLAYSGHPVAGDKDYSRGKGSKQIGLQRQFLHAHKLAFDHPIDGRRLEFKSDLPNDLVGVLESLRKTNKV